MPLGTTGHTQPLVGWDLRSRRRGGSCRTDTRALALGASPLCHIYLRAGSAARALIDRMAGRRAERAASQFETPFEQSLLAPCASIPGVSQRAAASFGPNRLESDGAERPLLLRVESVLGSRAVSRGGGRRYWHTHRPGTQEPRGVSADSPLSRIPPRRPRRGQRSPLARRRTLAGGYRSGSIILKTREAG
jgi:hypothetical protein